MNPASLCKTLADRFPQGVLGTHTFRGDATVTVRPEAMLEIARVLRDDPEFRMNFLMDLTAVDYLAFGKKPATGAFSNTGVAVRPPAEIGGKEAWPGRATGDRFEVVIHFFSLPLKHRLRIKVPVGGESPAVPSLTALWLAADWFEREVWDMYGIRFANHPNLKRLLMYDGFMGHPLRKDYPVNKRQPLVGPVN